MKRRHTVLVLAGLFALVSVPNSAFAQTAAAPIIIKFGSVALAEVIALG